MNMQRFHTSLFMASICFSVPGEISDWVDAKIIEELKQEKIK